MNRLPRSGMLLSARNDPGSSKAYWSFSTCWFPICCHVAVAANHSQQAVFLHNPQDRPAGREEIRPAGRDSATATASGGRWAGNCAKTRMPCCSRDRFAPKGTKPQLGNRHHPLFRQSKELAAISIHEPGSAHDNSIVAYKTCHRRQIAAYLVPWTPSDRPYAEESRRRSPQQLHPPCAADRRLVKPALQQCPYGEAD